MHTDLATDVLPTKQLDYLNKNESLWQAYQDKKAEIPMLFPTEGAKLLAVSELELMLANPDSCFMGTDCHYVLKQFEQFTKLESIFRNEYAVSEKLGNYKGLSISQGMGLMINVSGLDIRYFAKHWKFMLYVETALKSGDMSRSIQFYDSTGKAINKVFLRDERQLELWQSLIKSQVQVAQDDGVTIDVTESAGKQVWQLKTLTESDQAKLQKRWIKMKDVHQFFGILRHLKIDRASSYYQAPEGMAVQLKTDAVESLLTSAKESGCPIMIFVGNTGGVQIQTGTVNTVKRIGDWINILDKDHNDFTLHLKDKGIAQLWCVKRPTKDGLVTSVEAFNEFGETIVTFFGQRQEGEQERTEWLTITDALKTNHAL